MRIDLKNPEDRSGNELLFNCPRCGGNKDLWINSITKTGICYKCEWKLSPYQVKRMGDIEVVTTPMVLNPVHQKSLDCVSKFPEARDYLWRRGVEVKRAVEVGAKFDPEASEMWFPIYSPIINRVEWVKRHTVRPGWIAGKIDKKAYWFGRKKLTHSHLMLVEGVFDALRPAMGAISLLGSNLSEILFQQILFSKTEAVTIWFDADETGIAKAKAIKHRFDNNQYGRKLYCEILHGWIFEGRDPGEYSPAEARELYKQYCLQRSPFPIRMPA